MRIVKQLADWMRHSGKMDDKRYQAISDAICGVCPDEDGMKSLLLESGQEEGKAAEIEALEAWWDLHGARERARGRMARRMGGGGRKEKTTPIKVWHLDACLPKMLFPANADPDAFPLAKLLLAVAEAAHQRRIGPGWTAFAVAVADLFKADAGKLHDALRAAMENRGRELGPLFVELEEGKTLFPKFFLGGFSGESVTALLKRVNGDETDHTFETSDWILKHPNLNTVHQACLVRNRLHRIYRLWVSELADYDLWGTVNGGKAGICLCFGKTLVPVPALVWSWLLNPAAPHLGSLRGLVVFPPPWYSAIDGTPSRINALLGGIPIALKCLNAQDAQEWCPPRYGIAIPPGLDLEYDAFACEDILVLWPHDQKADVPALGCPVSDETSYWTEETWELLERHCPDLFKESPEVASEDADRWSALFEKCRGLAEHVLPEAISLTLWQAVLPVRPEIADRIPWQRWSLSQWIGCLERHPAVAALYPWGSLNGSEWGSLLAKHPQFADYCNWSSLSYLQMRDLFCVQPQLSDLCPYSESVWDGFSGRHWARLLSTHPEWADKCVWRNLEAPHWVALLKKRPEFADKCDWTSLEGPDWASLLSARPEFADKCDWTSLEGPDWVSLLSARPGFADKCDWTKLLASSLVDLLKECPAFADKCDWTKLEGTHWASLLSERPEFADKCDWTKLSGSDWMDLLKIRPEFADKCDWSKFHGSDWVSLLAICPKFADKCDWSKFHGSDWVSLLTVRPEFADKCNWTSLNKWNWCSLLKTRPEFADKCDWTQLDGWDVERLLSFSGSSVH